MSLQETMKFLNLSHLSQLNHAPLGLSRENLISLVTPASLDIQVNRTIQGNQVSQGNLINLDIQVKLKNRANLTNPVNQISQTNQSGLQNSQENQITQISTQVKRIDPIRKVQLGPIQ